MIETYRNLVTLAGGVKVLLRPMTQMDEQALIDLYAPISNEDLRYLRHNLRDPALIQSWCQNLDYAQVLPLVAMVKDRMVGQTSLHFRSGPQRHIGEVRIFLAKISGDVVWAQNVEYLMELAGKQDLHTLIAEIVTDQSKVIKAFQNLGFQLCCTLEDYFMLPDGDTRDVAILMLPLRPKVDEF